jgi:hypothetical protein
VRRIKIPAIFHASSRRDSRSHEVIRVLRRKTNRRHMTGDHHSRTARRATLLVTAADEILGTHSTEDRLHWVRDLDFDEDRSQVRTASGPRVMASLPGHHHLATIRRGQHRRRAALPMPGIPAGHSERS